MSTTLAYKSGVVLAVRHSLRPAKHARFQKATETEQETRHTPNMCSLLSYLLLTLSCLLVPCSGAAVGVASRADHLDINSTKLWSHSSRSSELPFSSNDDGGEATAETVKLSPKVFEVAAAVEEAAAEQREDDEEEKGELAVRSARAVASQDWRDAFKCGGDTRRKTESVSSEREITYSAGLSAISCLCKS